MLFHAHIQLAGMVRAVVREGTKVVRETPWFPNTITNSGLNHLGTATNVMAHLHLSSDNTATNTGTELVSNHIATAGGSRTSMEYDWVEGEEYFLESVYKYTYAPTGNAYTVAKLYLSPEADLTTPVFTEALVTDIAGDPTTISVRDSETLDVYYSIRQYIDTTQTTGTFTLQTDRGEGIVDTTFSYKVSPYRLGMQSPYTGDSADRGWDYCAAEKKTDIIGFGNTKYNRSYGAIWSSSLLPTDPLKDAVPNAENASGKWGGTENWGTGPYIPDSFKQEMWFWMNRSKGNATSLHDPDKGMRTFAIGTTRGIYAFEIQDPDGKGIMKTDYDTFTFRFEVSWGRKT